LYRSLLRYDYKENKFIPDLASCDIKNLAYIECYLNDNIKWSDGTPLNINDVKATYDSILSTEVNPIISSLLKETKIEIKDNIIIFSNTRNDINFLNVLLQPIVSQKILNTIGVKEINSQFPIEG
jgi:ABC-type transport system substrate-binding protein